MPCSLDSQGEALFDEQFVSCNLVTDRDVVDALLTDGWADSWRLGNIGLVDKSSLLQSTKTEASFTKVAATQQIHCNYSRPIVKANIAQLADSHLSDAFNHPVSDSEPLFSPKVKLLRWQAKNIDCCK